MNQYSLARRDNELSGKTNFLELCWVSITNTATIIIKLSSIDKDASPDQSCLNVLGTRLGEKKGINANHEY